ncbi:MAG: hypothetical protein US96_C0045G0006, partial [Candidatus Woesebacteria bacterium GW2011_GWB1_38_5b]
IKLFGREPKALLKEKTLVVNPSTSEIMASSSADTKLLDLETQESSESSIYVSDGFGVIYSKTENISDLPLIEVINQDLEIKNTIPELVVNTLSILERIKNMSVPVTSVKVLGNQLYLGSQPKLKFTLSNDLDRQTASLQLILQKDKMRLSLFPTEMRLTLDSKEKREIEMIDLRFDKPVVVYIPNK